MHASAIAWPPDAATLDYLAALSGYVLMGLLCVAGAIGWTQRRGRSARRAAEKARMEATHARERAQTADTVRSTFLATVSHEIRTPLNGVIGVLDILGDTPLDTEQRHYIDIATHSARLLLRVINDILDYAKIESGALHLYKAPYGLYPAMENIANLYLPLARRKGLSLTVAIMPHFDRSLIGDEIRIGQVVANLLNNAVSFTEHGSIVLSARRRVRRDRDHIEITVRDTGPGMSAEYQRHLYSPFQQEDNSTTRRHGGTGLGLSIVKLLLDLMGGTIHIHSVAGRGTRATVRLPAQWGERTVDWPCHAGRRATVAVSNRLLRPAIQAWLRKMEIEEVGADRGADLSIMDGSDGGFVCRLADGATPSIHALAPFLRVLAKAWRGEADSPEAGTAPLGPECTGGPDRPAPLFQSTRDLLLVEDNEINRDLTLRQLHRLGIEARAADDGESGYTQWLCVRPRIVLVDCHMPRLDGYGLARRIRIHEMVHGLPRTKLIGFSANATQTDAQACRAAGMDDYVPKPASRGSLASALRRAGLAWAWDG
ncbi:MULTISPECIES: ATP-binding protein [unclassified Achromobacter]|uniref:ATP-binding protein n=1 Tax=unclassified Achromobacter TaxID=2626865 RepID=UPI000B516F09|nr:MULTISPECIES: ATP-binding protein [unclassified Achromobacter]OWT77073.1 hypothetical protein CEY04_13860 [Achromobacter sp. HZ28]OWT77954.1 hypothetical protein CEY05_08355 [Achromobacter sp. HZ34]